MRSVLAQYPLSLGTAQFVLGKKLDVLRNFENIPEDTAKFIRSIEDVLESSAALLFQPPLYKIYPTKSWKRLLASFSGSSKYCAPVSEVIQMVSLKMSAVGVALTSSICALLDCG